MDLWWSHPASIIFMYRAFKNIHSIWLALNAVKSSRKELEYFVSFAGKKHLKLKSIKLQKSPKQLLKGEHFT